MRHLVFDVRRVDILNNFPNVRVVVAATEVWDTSVVVVAEVLGAAGADVPDVVDSLFGFIIPV